MLRFVFASMGLLLLVVLAVLEVFEFVVLLVFVVLVLVVGGLLFKLAAGLLLPPPLLLLLLPLRLLNWVGRSLILCVNICCFMFPLVEKLRSQTSHLNGLSFV